MKAFIKNCLLVFISFFFLHVAAAQNDPGIVCYKVASNFISGRHPGAVVLPEAYTIDKEGNTLAFLYKLSPKGFIVISADTSLHPVYAYSTENDFSTEDIYFQQWRDIIINDLSSRIIAVPLMKTDENKLILLEWQSLINERHGGSKFQQWPPAGSTSTGGWLESNWTQSPPYNNMCPLDLNTGNRSIAGCPAVAMGQIVNYHETINGTRFNNGDDYYHNYGAGNQYAIDNDSTAHDFPGFGTLNLYLDSIEIFYSPKALMPDNYKAALVFACGVAAKQVYSSSGSGTFGIDQAADAYQRFGFAGSRLVYPADTNLNHDLAENIMTGHPAHLGVVNSGMTAGHNVVVDGYNTDEFYHFNFGWGGSYNGWYTMPPSSMPYSLNYIEGIVLDINTDSAASQVYKRESVAGFKVYPNPVSDVLNISFDNSCPSSFIRIYDIYGRIFKELSVEHSMTVSLDMENLPAGIYIISAEFANDKNINVRILKY